jgi:hypothetical protein
MLSVANEIENNPINGMNLKFWSDVRDAVLYLFYVKLGHFTSSDFFLYVTNKRAYHKKTETFFFGKEKSFIGSAPEDHEFTNLSLKVNTYFGAESFS